jgi:hypothetical protein
MGPQPIDPNGLMQALVQDYLPLLGSHYGIGAGSLRSSIRVAPLPGNPTDGQIQNLLQTEINNGSIPPPDGKQLYFVFLAPGQNTPAGAEIAGGYHGLAFVQVGTAHLPIYYCVVAAVSDPLTSSQSLSLVASHELAEAVTDPFIGTGYIDPSKGGQGEIADIEEGQMPFLLNGLAVVPLSGPQGQMITVTPQTLIMLALEEAEALAFRYLAVLDPQFSPSAQAANVTLNSDPLYDAPPGQIGVLLGQEVFNSLF